jgi:hypothetical protein
MWAWHQLATLGIWFPSAFSLRFSVRKVASTAIPALEVLLKPPFGGHSPGREDIRWLNKGLSQGCCHALLTLAGGSSL